MIKVGIALNSPDLVNLVRLLAKHPDVEIVWIHDSGHTSPVNQKHPELTGEIDLKFTDRPDFNTINLFIGSPLDKSCTPPASLKYIFSTGYTNCACSVDHPVEIGLPEYNRKALVRGARSAYMPGEITCLGALALMPLAKNLLLAGDINASVLLTGHTDATGMAAGGCLTSELHTQELREKVLQPLQTSYNARLNILPFTIKGDVSMATFIVNTAMNLCDITQLYHNFYDDHRHVIILPENNPEVKACQVEGTNKSVIGLKAEDGRLFVSVAFDRSMKLGAGNITHIMNLLFGLDERTGF
ncbi:MAG: hypothetical protein K2L77_09570 [Muribaculaceae bacterium]|nr:hypothetical protein [Muribaculaceae bacterium]